jgi:hypothetical protein
MKYRQHLESTIEGIHREGRYRFFSDPMPVGEWSKKEIAT